MATRKSSALKRAPRKSTPPVQPAVTLCFSEGCKEPGTRDFPGAEGEYNPPMPVYLKGKKVCDKHTFRVIVPKGVKL